MHDCHLSLCPYVGVIKRSVLIYSWDRCDDFSAEAHWHYRAYICNLTAFKCILEKNKKGKKRKISLIEHIHPGGQTATVMNTALSENYSVLYPAVVEDEKKGPGRRVCTDTHTEPRKKWRANVQLGKQNPWSR